MADKPSEVTNAYRIATRCENCGKLCTAVTVEIPRGTEVDKFLIDKTCNCCGVAGKLVRF
jgi:hypothetical protein